MSAPLSDVTAVVLSIGEPTVARALASLARQTRPPAAVVRVDGVTPFHRALNAGIARVRTAFFAHVDADMILDPTALADLRACMAPQIGTAIGGLRDPLRGSIVGVKLYRTAAATAQPVPDSVSPAVDFLAGLRARGWLTAHALAYRPGPRALWHTFGEHQPDYTPRYTFTKFRLIGARYRHWRNGASLRRMCARLHAGGHPLAALAQAAALLGVFWPQTHDALRPCAPAADADRLAALLGPSPAAAPDSAPLPDAVQTAFIAEYRRGCALARRDDAAACRARFDALAGARTEAAWLGLIGFCRGLVTTGDAPTRAADELAELRALFPDGFGA